MTSLQQFMGGDHRHCDDFFYAAEEAARAGNIDALAGLVAGHIPIDPGTLGRPLPLQAVRIGSSNRW